MLIPLRLSVLRAGVPLPLWQELRTGQLCATISIQLCKIADGPSGCTDSAPLSVLYAWRRSLFDVLAPVRRTFMRILRCDP